MNVYQLITDRIVSSLERGVAPWNRPWRGAANQPRSLASGHEYRGINVFILNAMGYSSPYWLTFNQANKLRAHIRKGEHASPVVFWKFGTREVQDGDDITCERTVLARYYSVFNVEQVEGLNVPSDLLKPAAPVAPIADCEALLSKYLDKPTVKHSEQRAWYHKALDLINLPKAETFISQEHYYATLFHELVHSTGHPKRLNRPTLMETERFGDANYSKEELVAEMGAAFLCGHAGIENQTIEQSASYLDGWLHALRNDRRMLISAASQAQRAVDYMLGQTAAHKPDQAPTVCLPDRIAIAA